MNFKGPHNFIIMALGHSGKWIADSKYHMMKIAIYFS